MTQESPTPAAAPSTGVRNCDHCGNPVVIDKRGGWAHPVVYPHRVNHYRTCRVADLSCGVGRYVMAAVDGKQFPLGYNVRLPELEAAS